ncbi:MAG: hypothetical protein Q8876_03715 [Bacillota bacterium]|nr:hypothetical protein [Bacillota bacterium]
MANEGLKNEIKEAGLYFWQVATRLGTSDAGFSRKLRLELSDDEKLRVRKAIKELVEKRAVRRA